jgi:hypothetical protein
VSSRRALPLVLAVAGLVALAALGAHGHPLTGSRGSGPTAHFFDYVFTTITLVAVAIAVVFLYGVLGSKWSAPTGRRPRMNIVQLLLTFAASLLLGWLLLHARWHARPKAQTTKPVKPGKGKRPMPLFRDTPGNRGARLQWDEVALVAALLAAAGVAAFAGRKAKPLKEWRFDRHEEIALALDESLDDLRSEPDVRRAIIAAYARMEHALAVAGIPRRPSEAPFEYLSRALQSLDASGPPVTRLTDLFEQAKFSHHEPDESMREDAIDALVAVRDELRAPAVAIA